MPNHVTNIIEAPKEVLDFMESTPEGWDEGSVTFDFNQAVPQPKGLHNPHATFTDAWKEWEEEHEPDSIRPRWYEWSLHYWGTKWNAYDYERVSDTQVRFDTAWSHPIPVIVAISQFLFPKAELHVKYADEDLGHNFGEYKITGSDLKTLVSCDTIEEGSEEALNFACQIKNQQSYKEFLEELGED